MRKSNKIKTRETYNNLKRHKQATKEKQRQILKTKTKHRK